MASTAIDIKANELIQKIRHFLITNLGKIECEASIKEFYRAFCLDPGPIQIPILQPGVSDALADTRPWPNDLLGHKPVVVDWLAVWQP